MIGLNDSRASAPASRAPALAPPSAVSGPAGNSRPPRILVIEDERTLQEAVAYNLKRARHGVGLADSARTGREEARRHAPDLILLDVLLPGGMGGLEVCRLLRGDLAYPIIMVSAPTDEVGCVVGFEVGRTTA